MSERLFTFGVYNEDTVRAIEAGELGEDQAPYDEIDVVALSLPEATHAARSEADYLYGKGSLLFPLPPGGSAGLVQIIST